MANQIYCKHCGKLIDADSAFCMYCGGAIQDSRKSESFIRLIGTSDTKKVESPVDLIKWIINLKKQFINFIKQNWKRILIFIIGIAIAVLLVWLGIDKLKSNRAMLIIPAILLIILTLYLSCGKSIKFLLPSSILLLFVYGTYIYDDYKNIYGQDTTFFDTVKRELYWMYPNYTIPDGAVIIDSYAFDNCSFLKKITIPDSITAVGYDAFDNCKNLKGVYISDLSAWCKIDFYNVWANPLFYAKNLYIDGILTTHIIIPSNLSEIKNHTFRNCCNLEYVNIHNNITSIGECAFWGCSSLTSITIPDSVTSIGNFAFYDCTSLRSTIIGRGVTYIGQDAFDNCTGELIVNCNIPAREYDFQGVFSGSKFTQITIGNNVTRIGDYAFCNCDSLSSVIIGNNVISIGQGTFRRCNNLTNLTIGNRVKSIGNQAFIWSNLSKITIPSSVISIGIGAFSYCDRSAVIYCKSTIPPKGKDIFFEAPISTKLPKPNRTIFVPRVSVNAYKKAWSHYANNIVGYDF